MVTTTSKGDRKYGASFGEPLSRAKGVSLTNRELRCIQSAVALKISPNNEPAPRSDSQMIRAFLGLSSAAKREAFIERVETEAAARFL